MRRPGWLRRSGCLWAASGAAAGVAVLAVVLILTALGRAFGRQAVLSPPVVTVVVRPTATAVIIASPTTTATETPTPAATFEPGRLSIGGLAEVSGTEGDGLRLRQDPSTTGTIRLLGSESEVFIIQDGPVEADGRTWFYLVSPSDAARAGWAVADYLRPAQ